MEVGETARDSKKVYQVLYKDGLLSKPQLRDLLWGEGFEIVWIGAQNSHRKGRIAIAEAADGTYYGLTAAGKRQLSEWG